MKVTNMLDSINLRKFKDESFRETILEIYYENLFEKEEHSYDKILNSFQKMVAGFTRTKSILSDEAEESIFDIQRKIKKLHKEKEDRKRLWEVIEQFFADNLETDVKKALESTEYPEGVE